MSYPIDGSRRSPAAPVTQKRCCPCWCRKKTESPIQRHERELTQYSIDFTKLVRDERKVAFQLPDMKDRKITKVET